MINTGKTTKYRRPHSKYTKKSYPNIYIYTPFTKYTNNIHTQITKNQQNTEIQTIQQQKKQQTNTQRTKKTMTQNKRHT